MERCLYSRPNDRNKKPQIASPSRQSASKSLDGETSDLCRHARPPPERVLPPNFYVGDQDKKLWQNPEDAPITDIDANFLESWLWAKHPSLALENSIFEGLHDDGVGGQGTRERNETAMLTSLHSGTERACDFARTVRNLFFAFP